MDRLLLNYLPAFMQEFKEIKVLMNAEQAETETLWSSANNLFKDQFIKEATENGVKRWESMLEISPKDTDTLEERKFRILTRLNQDLPYTLKRLIQALTNLCGADGFKVDVQYSKYHIEVLLALSNEKNYGEVEKLLHKMIPANMTLNIKIMYNTHIVLSKLTHKQLSAYTHNRLKREVFE